MRKYTPILIWITLLAFIAIAAGSFVHASKQGTRARGDELFDKKNYKEAAQSYAAALKTEKKIEDRWHCAEREIVCWFRLSDHNEAEKRLEQLPAHFKGTLYEARGEVEAGNVLLKLPHWGYVSGGEFTRGRYKQGTYKQTWGADKNRAVKHLEKARDLYASMAAKNTDADFVSERMSALFDLAAALSRFSPYDSNWHNTWFVWGHEEDDTVGEHEGRNIRGHRYRGYNKLPKGLPVDPQGRAIFSSVPKDYDPALHPERKMKYILHEIEKADKTREQKYAGLALYRRAMLARARFGVDRLNRWHWYGYGTGNLKQAVEKHDIWELKDNEVLTLAGGRLGTIMLPADEDILALLKLVASDYPNSGMADEAAYAAALYHQTRKQFTRALEAYGRILQDFPKTKWTNQIHARINEIERAEVRIENTSLQLPGLPPKVEITHRNIDEVTFKAYPLDIMAYIRDGLAEQRRNKKRYYNENPIQNLVYRLIRDGKYKGYIGAVTATWKASVRDDGTYRYRDTEIECPLKKRGAYVIEALLEGGIMSRNILMLQDTAIVEKDIKDRKLYYVCDAVTGKPLSDMKLNIYSYSYKYDYKIKKHSTKFDEYERTTNAQGLLPFKPRTYPNYSSANVSLIASDADGRLAFHGFSYWNHYYNPYRPYSGTRAIVITDRPVYRPAQKVKFKIWGRHMRNGAYVPAAEPRSISVEIRDPKGNKLLTTTLRTDTNGGADGELELKEDAALGRYYIQVRLDGNHANTGGNYFQVEEYKKPEFEVKVTAAGQVKLGETFEALIKADYYFGAPVTDATVTYKVFREEFSHRYFFPAYWDWLYGSYYGIYWYDYDWFPWWGRWGSRCMVWFPWWGNSQLAQRDLITVGEGELDEKGELKIKIDTAKIKQQFGDVDHVYTVKAEVKDKSRRTIEGQGKIRVTRNEFSIFMQPGSGYTRTGETVKIKVRALTPDNTGKKTEGRVSIARIVYRGENNSLMTEKPIKEFSEATDDQGNLELALTFDKSGQYKVEYATTDGWGEPVKGVLVVWAVGDDFDGSVYRFNSLELLTDKRTYKVGETAHVMLNVARAGAWVLFADRIENGALLNYRVIELKNKSRIIDIPITKGGVPNFFIEATSVFDGKLHTEVREICVPPEQGMLNVAVTADKQEYRPGAKGILNVSLTDLSGEPVQGDVCLAAFDKSVLYIQPELTPDMKKFFYGQKRYHNIRRTSNLLRMFNSYTNLLNPSVRNLYHGGVPDAWFGSWGARHEDWRVVGKDNLGGSFGSRGRTAGVGAKMEQKEGLAAAEPSLAMDAAAVAPGAPAAKAVARKKSKSRGDRDEAPDGGADDFKEATTRTQFADTALWRATVATNAEGKAKVEMTFPENLTTWKINCFGMTPATQVGVASTSAITTKNFILRLQAPRFFIEKDEVVLSANVHNYLNSNKTARVSLDVPSALMELLSDKTQEVEVAAGGEVRVDWLIKIKREGEAVIKMSGLTDEESDAVQMKFPVYVHGMDKMVAQCGSIAPDDKGSTTVDLVVPEERDPSKSRLEVRFSPSLAGAMLDALPFLVAYPYGCTEQTISRFVPTVLTRKTLQEMGMNLSDIKNTLTNLNAQQLGDDKERLERLRRKKPYYYGWANNPVFDDAEVDRMIGIGLKRIYNFQHGDGGWGWWANDRSNPYLSAYVLFGLLTAVESDVVVQQDVLNRGLNFLTSTMITDIKYFKKHTYKANPQAFACWVLSMAGKNPKATMDILYTERDFLSVYGKCLLSLALWKTGDKPRAATMLENVLQYVKEDDENETAWLDTSRRGWWYWWNSDIESNALLIKAMTAQTPKDKRLPRLIKWLLNNRRHGSYWRSTRDTALCVSGMADYIRASGESKPDYTLNVEWDGKVLKKIKINKDNFFTFDNKFVIAGDALSGGKHKMRLVRDGAGAVYYSAYLNYFTKEEDIKGAGLEIKVKRSYFKLDRVVQSAAVLDTSGNEAAEKRLRYTRTKLENGAQLKSGDLLEIELLIESKNDYDYLAFEDMKPAGCEPVALRSGYTYGELCSNMELRDEKVVFFIGWLNQGKHLLKYRMRAEIPGTFHALPTKGFAMYAPELKCNSDEITLKIED